MRRLTTIVICLPSIVIAGLPVSGAAAEAGLASLTVGVTGMEPEGARRIALFERPDRPDPYTQLSPGRADAVPVDRPEAPAIFRDPPPRRDAILGHRDRKARFGFADFDDVAFGTGEVNSTPHSQF